MDRRTFILSAAAFAAGCTRKAPTNESAMNAAAPLGIQLYTLRDMMAEDVAATLELVARIGYREVEFAGYFNHTPQQMRALLDAAGLQAPSAHVGYADFAADPQRAIAHAAEMGHQYVVVPHLSEDQRSIDAYLAHCEKFNAWGEACQAAGLQFTYHNHAFEFIETDGQIPFDVLLSKTDPKLVAMQLDLAWARAGNVDPIAYFKAWPGRFPSLHIKDLDPEGNEADIGAGDVAFADIFAHAELAGIRHGFVERDHATDVRYSIKHNFDAISPLWTSAMAADSQD
jgi:sugar phosphate isomerase/epimerase